MCIWETSSSQQVVLCVQIRTGESFESSSKCRELVCAWKIEKCHVRGEVSQHLDYLMNSSRLIFLLFICSLLFAIIDERSILCVMSKINGENTTMHHNTARLNGWFKCNSKCTRTWFAFHKYAKSCEDESSVSRINSIHVLFPSLAKCESVLSTKRANDDKKNIFPCFKFINVIKCHDKLLNFPHVL